MTKILIATLAAMPALPAAAADPLFEDGFSMRLHVLPPDGMRDRGIPGS